MRAFCYSSGLIEFGRRLPDGALAIARGPAKPLRDFITAKARHGYHTEIVDGRRRKTPGSDCLLVPGIPEANSELARLNALIDFQKKIAGRAPPGVVVLSELLRQVLP